jgi:MarR family 2-MHQ and catechol resistance regulon transcriptional repressor
MKAFQALEEYAQRSINQTGMSFTDFAVLEMLLHKGPLPVNTIGAKIPLTSGSATTAVDRLENRNLVKRASDPRDRRARIVHLTSQGRKLIRPVFRRHRDEMERVASCLSESERAALIRLLKKLGTAAAANRETPSKGKKNVS